MAASKPKVFVTRKLPAPVEARMAELFEAVLNPDDRPRTGAELAAGIAEAEVFVPLRPLSWWRSASSRQILARRRSRTGSHATGRWLAISARPA